ncbi:MAG: type II secretion system protein, partial [Actinobacteria bacterium]|nr:type II secretion system protein [Actinomycetota bacterium]
MLALRRWKLTRRLRQEAGFTLVEIVIAATVFLLVGAGVTTLLVSSIVSHTGSRERTVAEQIAQAQIERARKLPYDNVGTPSGNPPGTIPTAGYTGTIPAGYAVAIDVERVHDPSPSANPTISTIFGDYKKISVVVSRSRDGRPLANVSSLVAPPSRQGGINGAGLRVTVKDWALPPASSASNVEDATVYVKNGPSSDRSDTTDERGQVEFGALIPTNASPPQNYYDVTVAKSGYVTFDPDLPPAPAAHIQLAPTQVGTTAIRVFKPASMTIALKDGSNPYDLPATVRVHSAKTNAWTTYTVNNPTGTLNLTQIAGDHVFPNVIYTVYAYTPTGLCSAEIQ